MRCSVLTGLLWTLALLCGCGGQSGDEPKKQQPLSAAEEREVKVWVESLRRQAQVKKEMVDILKTVKNRESMRTALDALARLNDKAEVAAQEVGKLAPPSEVVREQVEQTSVSMELMNLRQAELEAVRNILKLPQGKEFFNAVETLKKTKSP